MPVGEDQIWVSSPSLWESDSTEASSLVVVVPYWWSRLASSLRKRRRMSDHRSPGGRTAGEASSSR